MAKNSVDELRYEVKNLLVQVIKARGFGDPLVKNTIKMVNWTFRRYTTDNGCFNHQACFNILRAFVTSKFGDAERIKEADRQLLQARERYLEALQADSGKEFTKGKRESNARLNINRFVVKTVGAFIGRSQKVLGADVTLD